MEKSTTVVVIVALVAIVGITVLVLKQGGGSASDSMGPIPGDDSSTIEAVVWANGVSDLAGAQFNVRYDPTVVSYVSTSEGDFLDSGSADAAMLLDTAKDESGVVKDIILLRVQQPGVDGSGDLATLTFTRIADGDAGITLENALVSDSAGNPISPSALSVQVS